jgi:hypothetical protein
VGPDADAGEEMALNKSPKLIWPDIANVPLIDLAVSDQAGADQPAQPLCRDRLDFVVISPRHAPAVNRQ